MVDILHPWTSVEIILTTEKYSAMKLCSKTKEGSLQQLHCHIVVVVQDLQREVDSFELPDLEAEYTDEEGDRLNRSI